MKEKTIFPREEKSEVLFDKILNDPWAYNKLFQTFCNNLFCRIGCHGRQEGPKAVAGNFLETAAK